MTEREIVCICNTYGGKYILKKTPTKSDLTEYRTRMAAKSGERNFAIRWDTNRQGRGIPHPPAVLRQYKLQVRRGPQRDEIGN